MDPPGRHTKSRGLFRGLGKNRKKTDANSPKRHHSHNSNNSTSTLISASSVRSQEEPHFLRLPEKRLPQRSVSAFVRNGDDDEDYVHVDVGPVVHLPPALVRQRRESLQRNLHQHRQQTSHQPSQQQQQHSRSHSHHSSQQQQQQPRRSIHKKKASLGQYQITPIDKHYAVSRHILAAFDSNWNGQQWTTAYALGLQFVETALLELPKHGYFYSSRHERERMESALEAVRVAHLLQELLERQQPEQRRPEKTGKSDGGAGWLAPDGNLERIRKLIPLALEQVEAASTDQDQSQSQEAYQLSRREVEEELTCNEEDTTTGDWLVCESILSCAADANNCWRSSSNNGPVAPVAERVAPVIAYDPPTGSMASMPDAYSVQSIHTTGGNSAKTTITPKTTERPNMPAFGETMERTDVCSEAVVPIMRRNSSTASYLSLTSQASSSSLQTTEERSLQKALFLSGLEVLVAKDQNEQLSPSSCHHSRQHSATLLELSTLAQLYHEDFDSLQQTNRIRVSFADTFQGRIPESTNGCTVIAPLFCIHHLNEPLGNRSYETNGDPGLPDSIVEPCIDTEAPLILQELRGTLGLSEHAFLIPADTHDYLLEHGHLQPEQFCNVLGGNILNSQHLSAFVQAIEQVVDRKIAATLFFHEHVVAIIKLKRVDRVGKVTWWYDFIDSLPLKETLRRSKETPHEFCERLGMFSSLSDCEIVQENEMLALPKTARIRCLDAEALTAVIRWYACSKFNDGNVAYIDQYEWDDATCDFDPRVFQAFMWSGVVF